MRRAAIAILRGALAAGALSAGALSRLQAKGGDKSRKQAVESRSHRLQALQALMRLASDEEEEDSVHADVAATFDAIWGAPPSNAARAAAGSVRARGKGSRR